MVLRPWGERIARQEAHIASMDGKLVRNDRKIRRNSKAASLIPGIQQGLQALTRGPEMDGGAAAVSR